MTHKLVQDLRFVREQFERNFDGLSAEEGEQRLGKANSIGWIVGHLADFEQSTHCEVAQGKTIIIVTHDSEMAKRASRVALISDGVIASDKPNGVHKGAKA